MRKTGLVVLLVMVWTLAAPMGASAAPRDSQDSVDGWFGETWSWVMELAARVGLDLPGKAGVDEGSQAEGDEDGSPQSDPDG